MLLNQSKSHTDLCRDTTSISGIFQVESQTLLQQAKKTKCTKKGNMFTQTEYNNNNYTTKQSQWVNISYFYDGLIFCLFYGTYNVYVPQNLVCVVPPS